ncbi:unnamed protein product [Auanema sp. JU1783]|nr:unnamed protein product [Auanema sp. JU1783]
MASNDVSWLSEETEKKNQEDLFQSFLSEDESRHCSFSTSFAIYRDTSMASYNSDDNKENNEDTEHEENTNEGDACDSDSYYTTHDVSMMSISSPAERKKPSSRTSKVMSKIPVKQKKSISGANSTKSGSILSTTQSSILDDVVEEDQRNLLLELYPELANQSQCSVVAVDDDDEPSTNDSFQLNIEYVDPKKNSTPELIDLTADSFNLTPSPENKRPVARKNKNNFNQSERLNACRDSSDDDDDQFNNFLQALRKPVVHEVSDKEEDAVDNENFVVSDDEIIYTTDGSTSSNDFIDDEDEDEEEIEDDEEGVSRDSSPKRSRNSPADVFSKQFNTPSIRVKLSSQYDHFLNSLSINFTGKRHRDAEKYIQKGIKNRTIRDELTEKLFLLYKNYCFNDLLPMDYEHVTWNARLRKTAGLCKNSFRNRTATIELSTKVCTTPERLRDTLVHELCHAATWLIDGVPKAGHGPVWKRWTNKCVQKFPSLPSIDRCHTYDIEAKYVYVCNGCGQRVKRHSKSLDITKKICGRCRGHFVLNVDNEKKKREPSKFAKFVKDNYGKLKSSGTPHKEIMVKLSEMWKTQQIVEATSLDISVMSIHEE